MGRSLQQGRERWPKVRSHIPLINPSLNSQPEKLKGSKFDTPEYLAAFAQGFNEGLKMVFSDDQAPQYVKFGSPRDNDAKCEIKAGKLTLTG